MGMVGQVMKSSYGTSSGVLDVDRWLASKDGNIYQTGRLANDRWHIVSVFDDGVDPQYKVTVAIRDRQTGNVVHAVAEGYDAAFKQARTAAGMP